MRPVRSRTGASTDCTGSSTKHSFRTRGPSPRTWFTTAGLLGAFRHLRQPEWKEQRPDGSTVVWPGYRSFKAWRPAIATIGLGVERQVKRHLATRADLQVFAGQGGVGVRIGAGLSLPLGGGHASRP